MTTIHLDKLLDPESLVIIGASAREASPGFIVARNLIQGGYKGEIHLVNPRYTSILDRVCHKRLKALESTPDLAIILTPSRILKRTLLQCSHKGIRVAIIMSGASDTQALHDYAQRLGIRLMGPYCAGFIRPHLCLNATYSDNKIATGSLAIVSQSASVAAAMLDWAQTNRVGFSALLSTGEESDIGLSDLLDLLAEDYRTKAVIVYVESINASRGFLSALSAISRLKPVVLMRSANESARFCDALTRTGEVYSSDMSFQAALNRAGVVRIRTFSNLFAAARILATGIRIKGDRLAIVSNGSAPAMMAVERMEIKHFQVPQLQPNVLKQWQKSVSGKPLGRNPVILREATGLSKSYPAIIQSLQEQDEIDAILILFAPDSRNDPAALARCLASCKSVKPILACWMGDASVQEARKVLAEASIPSFRTPEAAVDGFDFLHRYYVSQQQLLQLPDSISRNTRADVSSARKLVQTELLNNQRVLGPMKTRALLHYFDIPTLASGRAESLDEALNMANSIAYPLAVKLVSPNISYKASVIETQLNVDTSDQLRDAWTRIAARLQERRPEAEFRGVLLESMHLPSNARHLAVSLSRDATFGPVLSLGVGGDLTALVHRRAVQLPPLNQFLVEDLLKCREVQTYLGAFRHSEAVDDAPVAQVLRRLSEIACELPDVFSLDINPLVVSKHGAIAMDVQIVLQASKTNKRYEHLAIHPYPWQWIREVKLKHDTQVTLRPIRPDDAASIRTLVREMSAESRYFRFMHAINELSPQMLAQFTKLDYDRQMAFVACAQDSRVIGVSRYVISSDRLSGEFAISISENWKGIGLASALMSLLIEHARDQQLTSLHGDVLRSNTPMQALMNSLGFSGKVNRDEPDILVYEYNLNREP